MSFFKPGSLLLAKQWFKNNTFFRKESVFQKRTCCQDVDEGPLADGLCPELATLKTSGDANPSFFSSTGFVSYVPIGEAGPIVTFPEGVVAFPAGEWCVYSSNQDGDHEGNLLSVATGDDAVGISVIRIEDRQAFHSLVITESTYEASIELRNLPLLDTVDIIFMNNLLGVVIENTPSLTYLRVASTPIIAIDLSLSGPIETLNLSLNTNLFAVVAPPAQTLTNVNVAGSALDEASIDALIYALNPIAIGTFTANGGANAPPSPAALAYLAGLSGFTYLVN